MDEIILPPEFKEQSPRCLKCKWLVEKDTGYSNWTVTGETFSCALNQFDSVDDDNDNHMAVLKAAGEDCQYFFEGTGIRLDCDGEDFNKAIEQREWALEFIQPISAEVKRD